MSDNVNPKTSNVNSNVNKPNAGLGLEALLNDYYWACEYDGSNGNKTEAEAEAEAAITAHIEAVCNEVINRSLIHVGDIVQSDHLSIVADTVDKLKTAQRQKLAELLHSKQEGITYGGGSRG